MTPVPFFAQPRSAVLADFTVAALAVLALFAALNVHGYDPTYALQSCNLFLLLTLIMIKLFSGYRSPLTLPANPAILGFAVFLGWVALSMLWSPVPGDSFMVALTVSTALWAMLLGFWANDRQWSFFRLLLIPLALLIVAMTAYQAFVLKIDRPAGFLLNWNTNSAFLGAILVPYCADYLRQVSQRRFALLTGLFLACCTFGMSLGQGRGSLFALGIVLLLLFFAYRTEPRAFWGIVLTLIWVIAGYVLGDVLHGGLLAQRLSAASALTGGNGGLANIEALGSGREYLWPAGWRMYLDRPWLGWGIGVFHWLYPRYRTPLYVEDGNYVHNDYLQFLIELGPMGLLLSVFWVLALFRLGWRLFRSSQETDPRFTDLALALACAAMLLHAAVDFHLYQSPMLMVLGAYAGRLSWRYWQQTGSGVLTIQPHGKFTSTGYFSILAAVFLFLGMGLLNLVMGFLAIRDANLGGQPLAVFKQMNRAQTFLPFIEEFQSGQGLLILTLIKNEPDKIPSADRDGLIHYALQQVDQAIENNPLSALNHNYKAELLMLLPGSKPAEIIEHLQQSLVINPYQLDARLALANTLEKTGAAAQARHVLAKGLNKSYIADAEQAGELLSKIDRLINDSAESGTQKQAIQQQMQSLAAMKLASPYTLHIFTLPDIGWKP